MQDQAPRPGSIMSQLALLPLDTIAGRESAKQGAPTHLVRMPGRTRRSPRTAIGAPGFLSVRAAAERLGLQPGVLCPNGTLEGVARKAPRDTTELRDIPELRRWQAEVLGAELVGAVDGKA